MIRITSSAIAAGLVALLAASSCRAQTSDTTATLYSLVVPPSALQFGCFGPCECADQLRPTYGSFELIPTSVDPLYTNYAIERYIASFNNGPGAIAITGSGRYRVGGEVALVQEMTLDLSVEGGPIQHFDSGLVPVPVRFPELDVSCALHGFACFDSVVVVGARPVGTTGVPPTPQATAALTAVRPNPFRGGAMISWTLPRSGPADLTVVDLEGRQVRGLSHGQPLPAGPQSVTWDGRRDDGRNAPAGVYWVWLRSADGSDRRRIVKLD
jgi:hypothetical protein